MNALLLQRAERTLLLTGRVLLGIYFIVPGIMKITGWSGTITYMEAHGVPMIPVLLVITIALQIGGGACLAIGYRTQIMAFLLAGLTLVISLFMHNFWTYEAGMEQAHEMQNFIKNLAIMAGLLCVAGTPERPRADS